LAYCCLFFIRQGLPRASAISVIAIVIVYAWLKRYTFLPPATFLAWPYFTTGLSYIFFRVLHLAIETKQKKEIGAIGFLPYLIYTVNFTTLVSGPIQRYDDFAADQFATVPPLLDAPLIWLQIERIVRGLFKVNIVAMLLDIERTHALSEISQQLSAPSKWAWLFLSAIIYPFFLYANFSGYIDIVLALARLMRVRLPENFDRPFSACSFIDFWNRWHITLSTWLKHYVYNPLLMLLMRRVSMPDLDQLMGVFCFFVTFFLVGLWHGRTSEFMFFGILQGGGVALNKLWQVGLAYRLGRSNYKALTLNSLYRAFSRGLTFTWFAFTLFWFWASWAQLDAIYVSLGLTRMLEVWVSIWISATMVLAVWEWLRAVLLSIHVSGTPLILNRYSRVAYTSVVLLITFFLTVLLNQPAPAIVYKAF